jgi:hypothetical protein
MVNRRPDAGYAEPYRYQEPDEYVTAGVEQPTGPTGTGNPVMDAFRENVLNPPARTRMTYPKNTLAGLDAAFKIAAEKTPYEQNRVYVDGDAYQQVKQYTDPTTGEKKYINKYKQPGFGEQVMRAMPASISPAVDILNQQREDQLADWELKNKGYKEAMTAESQLALAGQRQAQAAAIPRGLDIKQMDAETRRYLASLKDIPESEKLKMLEDGRMSRAAYDAQARYTLQELRGQQAGALETQRQGGRMELEGTRQGGREAIEGIRAENAQALERMKQTGRVDLEGVKHLNAAELEDLRQSGRLDLESERQVNREINLRIQGENAVRTRQTVPGGAGTSGSPRTGAQARAAKFKAENPKLAEFITEDEFGFPKIEVPSTNVFGQPTGPTEDAYILMREAIYAPAANRPAGTPPPGANPPAAPIQAPAPGSTAPIPMTGGPTATTTAPNPAAAIPGTGPNAPLPPVGGPGAQMVEMTTPDGKGTRMVPPNMVQQATAQGYTPVVKK